MPSTEQPTEPFTFPHAVDAVRRGDLTDREAAERLVQQLSDKELLWLLDGDVPIRSMVSLPAKIKAGPITAGQIDRLGIPGIRFSDGPRGVVMGRSTAFPVTMARGATWDPDLEEQVGLAMGKEARAQGANYSGAICINLLRHPAWGRSQETYGEDPVLLGRMGVALTRGVQRNVQGCVKHYALNSMENARFKVDVKADDHALHEVYLPHFKAVIDTGADSVMSSYNSINGAYAGENKVLLTDILRDEWGFEGTVTSDWVFGTHEGLRSLEAGMDVEMPCRMHRARELPGAIKDGRLPKSLVLTSARRILATGIRREAQRDREEPSRGVIAGPEHRALARAVAIRGTVLLKNAEVGEQPLLPLPATIPTLAVIGPLAAEPNTGDHGSSLVDPPSASSPLGGLREARPGTRVRHADGSDLAAAAAAARSADAAVVVVGMSFDDEGERVQNDDMDISAIFGFPFNTKPVQWAMSALASSKSQFGRGGDRSSLRLHPADERLIAEVAAANPRTVVIMIGGSAILTESWRDAVPAVVMGWYPGMEGGRALADVLTGVEEPGGRLPFAIPTDEQHLPFFDAEATEIVYDSWWGQRKLDRDGRAAAYPFGFGLGYTTFDVELADVRSGEEIGTATVVVRNTGARPGSTVAQVYAADADAVPTIPQLIGFQRVELAPGEERTVEVTLDLTPTRQRDPETRVWSTRLGTWVAIAAQHSPSGLDGARPLRRADRTSARATKKKES